MRYPLFHLAMSLATCSVGQADEPTLFLQEVITKGDIITRELKDSLQVKNFSTIWTTAPHWLVYGSIGEDHQRLRMKLLSVIKDDVDPTLYRIYGKNKVKTNICAFQGELRITNIRKYSDTSLGLDNAYMDSSIQGRFLVCGTYRLLEDPSQHHAGILTGTFASYFYIDRTGAVRYDDIDEVADGYTNNQFVGSWASYTGRSSKRCNWGDMRIPNSKNFDIGAGEFSPSTEFLMHGWENFPAIYQTGPEGERARSAERVEWWR